ncbi:MAG: biotin/lipoyl-binding protein [Oligoflexia bacterium]|nr:biotin/lipoyl-binding protein [Oligoflexia bacterium]
MAEPMKVLVANRGEIACRVFQACREMGLRTVGIVAPGDEQARHVTYAEELFRVTGYLDAGSILEAARRAGARVIHPGYGFLSERPDFADAVEQAGFAFAGPRGETMRLLGAKINAKKVAAREGIPTLPWATAPRRSELSRLARRIGYPLLLKASAGGGGKGMRRVERPQELEAAAESASAEALAAFGDGTLFLEKLLERPRHIEVQVFGDGEGGGLLLHDRECSLQRRHQKIWEEATAPHLPAATREGLFEAALGLVRAVRYRGAGTVEFLVDATGDYFFLEMNTRLQVEHPVTELVTGVDLVWAQLAQALDPTEPILTEMPSARGHAIEVRLYAEDPSRGYVPTPGKIARLRWPSGAGIRVDSGIEEGQEIGVSFDSMLGKLIAFARNRDQALARLRFALEETVILGTGALSTNQAWLLGLAAHPGVREGRVDTGFLSRETITPFPGPTREQLVALAAAQAGTRAAELGGGASPWHEFGAAKDVELRPGGWAVLPGSAGERLRLPSFESVPRALEDEWDEPGSPRHAGVSGEGALIAQFPGKVRRLLVTEGRSVAEGEPLVWVEAMKMEFSIEAPFAGVVAKVLVREGQSVSPGDRFLELEPAPAQKESA